MKYFTKEYIKECDCGEIQKLRDFIIGNWCSVDGEIELLFANSLQFIPAEAKILWLPTGDDLDLEIVKIMKNNYNGKELLDYQAGFEFDEDKYFVAIVGEFSKFQKIENFNPLIAKIKLLKQLLKE